MKKRTEKKTVLITGGSGLLGVGLLKTAPQKYEIIPVCNSNLVLNYLNFKWHKFNVTKQKHLIILNQIMLFIQPQSAMLIIVNVIKMKLI